MNEHSAALAFAHAIAILPGLELVNVYGHDVYISPAGEESPAAALVLPAITITIKSEALSGSATFARATVEITVESQADDEKSDVHSARVQVVKETMKSVAALSVGFALVPTVELLGRPSLSDTDPDAEHRAFKTPLTYKAGLAAA